MRRLIFSLVLLGFTNLSFGQEMTEEVNLDQPRNELSLNLPLTVFGEFPMVSYERISNEDLGFGASLGFGLGDALSETIQYQLTPFARWYFTGISPNEVYGRKFFIEANASLFGFEDKYYENNSSDQKSDKMTGFGLGLGIGYKYVNKSNWIGTLFIGGGKNFADAHDVTGYPHMGINIGKRF